MRKLFFILTIGFFTTTTYGQMFQIQSMNGEEICNGFLPENQAQVRVVGNLPLSPPENTYITYMWTSTHERGVKTWDTNRPDRRVPIPWTGDYTVQVKVMYTRHGNTRPYAVFWSNPIKVTGRNCKP